MKTTSHKISGSAREWRLGSRPNLTQMHHDARSRVEDLVEDGLITAIENDKPHARCIRSGSGRP